MIKLKEGGYYRALDGSIHGPLKKNTESFLSESGEKLSRDYFTFGFHAWNENGMRNSRIPKDLLNLTTELIVTEAPKPVIHEKWINIYRNSLSFAFPSNLFTTREQAVLESKNVRIKTLARVKITFEEGEGLE